MMASKASMLKSGVKKTGTGLFAGMSPINEEKNNVKSKAVVQKVEEIVEETPIPEPIVETKEEPVKKVVEQKTVQPQNIQQYEEPVQRVAREYIEKQVEEAQLPVTKNVESKAKNSRYEKEKFLLLDIRGYRDYVEHMAKAANTSATKYIRELIENDMKQNMDIYIAHKQLEERLKERK